MLSPQDPAAFLLLAVAALACVALVFLLLRPRRSGGVGRGSVVHDQPLVAVGDAARSVLDRAARLQPGELQQLQRDYRRLDRFWSGGSLVRLLDLLGGAFQLLQPTGSVGDSVPILRGSELRGRLAVGDACEAAILARSATATQQAAANAGLQSSPEMARAVADAAIALEAGARLTPDDRATLAWPWRDATEHVSSIPNPGTVVPWRFAGVVMVVVAVLAGAAISGGAAVSMALGFFLGLGGVIVAAVALFRLVVWHPILRVPPTADVGSSSGGKARTDAGPPSWRAGGTAATATELSLVPRPFAVAVMVVAAILAALAIMGGSPPVDAIAVFAVLGGIVVAFVALVRLLIWRPIRRAWVNRKRPVARVTVELPAPSGESSESIEPIAAADGHLAADPALPFSPRTPSFAHPGRIDIDLPSLGLGVLAVLAFGLVGSGVIEGRLDATWAVVAVALPALLAGIIGVWSRRGAGESLLWHLAGALVTAGAGLLYVAIAFDPRGEVWPYLAILFPVFVGVPIALGYGAGVALGRRSWAGRRR